MPTVGELTELYENFLLAPRPGKSVCVTCFNFTDGYRRCYACTRRETWLDAMAPISYCPAHGQLHHVLASYKRLTGDAARRSAVELAAVLWRYLTEHEGCVAKAAGVTSFPLVTTVPSGEPERGQSHPLRHIVGELVRPTRDRHERLLRRSSVPVETHVFSRDRYEALKPLTQQAVLLVDDTWTTGANAQSAAAALKRAGAGPVGAVVIGRYLNRDWHENDQRLGALPRPFGWDRCALCADQEEPRRPPDPTVRPGPRAAA